MSPSINIPRRKKRASDSFAATPSSASSSSRSSFEYGSFASSNASPKTPSMAASPSPTSAYERRPSLMSPEFSRTEHTVINVGNSENPRLITCVKASQGFDWNQEIFLPSYTDHHFDDLERRQDPVEDIVVTDEEIKNMLPS